MAIVLDPSEPPINRGIKTVGIGKKGSKSLTFQLALEIAEDLKSGKVSEAAKGAFFAGLCAKGIGPDEEVLGRAFPPGVLDDPAELLKTIAADAPEFVLWICRQLSEGHTLDKQTAYDLGKFLFSEGPGDAARGWVASFLRVRYETDDEYEGLLQAMEDTLGPPFKAPAPEGEPVIQISEPFDGTDHSYMITPLIGRALQAQAYRVVHQVGRNSGPKAEMNLWDIARALGTRPAASNADLSSAKPEFGWFFHQSVMSQALDRWVDLRRQIIKRPFLATLERFIDPLKAQILIASAFHPPYGEKMAAAAERAGFKGIIIVRNGIEGTVAFPLLRDVKLLLSARQKDGSFLRHEMTIENPRAVEIEEMVEKPRAADNAKLIEAYIKEGSSGNKHFDARVGLTCEGICQALKNL
ncbi:MAG: anthranilate phosphoribosyltransferase [Candidatus Omnitrophica bacterium]|nr:anthranilate phosphoribosyltransferase [Candidatus Omnitrophota bacterium]